MKISYLFLIILIISISSCKKENCFDCFKGVGKQISEERKFDDFKIITINDPFTIFLIQDSLNKLELIGGENLISSISSEINNNELIINNHNKCNWARSYKKSKITLNIHLTQLDSLYIIGECDVFSKDTLFLNKCRIDVQTVGSVDLKVKAKELIFWPIGNGDFTISGSTNYYFLGSLGAGNIYSNNLKSHFTTVTCRSVANNYVYSDNILIIDELGYGNIYYYGNPDSVYVKKYTGDGKLIKQ